MPGHWTLGRGLFRLWVIGSLSWVATVVTIAGREPVGWPLWKPETFTSSEGHSYTLVPPGMVPFGRWAATVAPIAFGPPLVAFVLGLALLWVVRGFRR